VKPALEQLDLSVCQLDDSCAASRIARCWISSWTRDPVPIRHGLELRALATRANPGADHRLVVDLAPRHPDHLEPSSAERVLLDDIASRSAIRCSGMSWRVVAGT
jgi:hypothetical protein